MKEFIGCYSLIAVAISLSLGCGTLKPQKVNSYDWQKKGTYHTNVQKPTNILQSLKINDNKISFYNQFEKKIFLYDLETGKFLVNILLDDILPKKLAQKTVLFFHFFNSDSILMMFNAAEHPYYFHDSLLVIVNLKNSLINYLDIKKLPVIQQDNSEKNGNYYWFPLTSRQLVWNNLLLIPLKFYGSEIGDTFFVNKKPYVAGIYNFETSHFKLLPINYPTQLGKNFPREMKNVDACNYKEPYISFAHTDLIYRIFNDNEIAYYHLPSFFIEEIKALPEYIPYLKRPNTDISYPKYLSLNFHPGLNLYYRFVRIPAPDFASDIDKKNFPSYSIQFFNLEKNYYAETLIPDSLASNYWDLIPYKNGFLVPSKHSQTIDFDYYELIPKKISKIDLVNKFEQKYRNQKRETGFINYLKIVHNFSRLDGNYLIIPTMKSCPPCADALMKLLCENKKYWLKSDLKVIIIGTLHRFDELFKKINCNSEGFWLDKEEIFWEYEPEFINFKFITIENEKIIDERILNPGDLNIIQKLIESLKIVNSK